MIALYVYDTTTHSLYIDTCINAYTHCTLYTTYYVYTMYTLTYRTHARISTIFRIWIRIRIRFS